MGAASPLDTVRTIDDLRARVTAWRADGLRIGLVPTMGALHAGHVSLVKNSVASCDKTVVTLFVNPTQFGPKEDFSVYPRDEARDAALVAAEGADLLFAPGVEEVYPGGHSTKVHVGGLGDVLEGEHRPGFFTGVATVVTKLLLQALPDEAFFGEKDYQQLQVIKKLIRDLDIPVTATGVQTVREADGLALSSRNAYLTPAERATAPVLHGTLAQVAEQVGRGEDPRVQEAWAKEQLERAGFWQVDYVTVRDAATLDEVPDASRPARVLAAAWLGKARLIDNVAV
ncbi:pantoate--beta-alanine ligase [Thalassospiraceae bacterium LMO-SO8]|nr:pantoate--beta-alanine ligase [Alphaproteobacteria bacterium LMO-S08]WND77259.1 pantoate--beta-alanine ligase [Thalassospiraceae bacterium LMO-SO8]